MTVYTNIPRFPWVTPPMQAVNVEMLRLDPSALADAVAARVSERLTPILQGARIPRREAPTGVPIRMYVTAKDVVASTGCSRSEAYRKLRSATGRKKGTKRLLRVPLDVWERYIERDGGLGR